MVSNVLPNIFEIGKNDSWTFLRTFFNAVFNSKHISSSKDFSKMLLKARNGPWIDRAAILILDFKIQIYFVGFELITFIVPIGMPSYDSINSKKFTSAGAPRSIFQYSDAHGRLPPTPNKLGLFHEFHCPL